jgi:ribosomal protein S18 acetylase RimI-like enzyme
MTSMRVLQADSTPDIETVRQLCREYEHSLGIDLCFQGFEAELAGLPGEYAPPRGRLFLTMAEELVAGCVALRPLEEVACEMKRLFVRPEFRGRGLGRLLAVSCIDAARGIGYTAMRLDTLPSMREAIAMYRTLGFREIAPYRHNPVGGTLYMELDLR